MKKIIALLLSLTLMLGVSSVRTSAASTVASGSCGTKASWTLDNAGTLTISGSGDMTDYIDGAYGSTAPWMEYRWDIYKIVIKEGITHVGDYAFWCVHYLNNVSLPESLTSIGKYAFYETYALRELHLPGKLKTIGSDAFSAKNGSPVLEELTIPASVRTIGSYAFYYQGSIKKLIIKSGVTSLGARCFEGCASLTSVVIPDSVTTIGEGCFAYTDKLKYAVLPRGLTSISDQLFYFSGIGCAVVPKEVTNIGSEAFAWCDNLKWVSLPKSLLTIKSNAFYLTSYHYDLYGGLEYVLYEGSQSKWKQMSILSGNDRLNGSTLADIRYNTYNPFVDVSPAKNYFDEVLWAYDKGIVNGTKFYLYSPSEGCTRAQMAVMLWRMNGSPSVSGTCPFKDISELSANVQTAIKWAYKKGIVSGTGSTTYSPNSTVTREQMAIMLWRMAGEPSVSLTGNPFTDIGSLSSTSKKAILWAYKNGITKGTDSTHFSPKQKCTRAQLAIFLYRINEKLHLLK